MKGRKPVLKPVDGALVKVPKPPRWLPVHAVKEWRRVAPDLVDRRILTADNLSLLESYSLAIGMVRTAADTVEAEGLTVVTKAGCVRHPAAGILREFMAEARRLAAELGLTPTSRNKVGESPSDPEEDALADLGV
jgi:P27 family predicted phage terminase small subunit